MQFLIGQPPYEPGLPTRLVGADVFFLGGPGNGHKTPHADGRCATRGVQAAALRGHLAGHYQQPAENFVRFRLPLRQLTLEW